MRAVGNSGVASSTEPVSCGSRARVRKPWAMVVLNGDSAAALGIGVDPLMITGHGRELIDQPLGNRQPLADVGLTPRCGSAAPHRVRRLPLEFDDGILRHGRLAVRHLRHPGGVLLPGVLGLPCRSSTRPSRGEGVPLLKLTPVVADSRGEPILELKGCCARISRLCFRKSTTFIYRSLFD